MDPWPLDLKIVLMYLHCVCIIEVPLRLRDPYPIVSLLQLPWSKSSNLPLNIFRPRGDSFFTRGASRLLRFTFIATTKVLMSPFRPLRSVKGYEFHFPVTVPRPVSFSTFCTVSFKEEVGGQNIIVQSLWYRLESSLCRTFTLHFKRTRIRVIVFRVIPSHPKLD